MFKFIGVLLLVTFSCSFKIEAFSKYILGGSKVDAINWPFTTCGKGTWTPNSLSLQATPTRNSNNAITMKGVAQDYIEFKKVDVNVKLNGLFLHSQSVDYTKIYDSGDQVEFNYTNFVPSFAPAGTYTIQFSHKDTSGKQNGCWSMTFKL